MTMTLTSRRSLVPPLRPEIEDDSSFALLSIGFRPFFFLATICAIVWVPLWLVLLRGAAGPGYFPPVSLHAHEMLFGFAGAVIAGFLLTAAANWTQRATTSAATLAALALLWAAGRVVVLVPELSAAWVFAIDASFLPALALVLGGAILRAQNWRNVMFLVMLLLLSLSNVLMHLGRLPDAPLIFGTTSLSLGTTLALRTITLMIIVMGGRVIPMFTRNGTGVSKIARDTRADRWAISLFVLAVVVDLWAPGSVVTGTIWLLAGIAHLIRMRTWGTRHAKPPLLWILHLGYAAVAASFILEGLGKWGYVPASSAIHMLTVGGIGGLCLGMMTRVSLGHSGRMLIAPTSMTIAFSLVAGATAVRVLGQLIPSFDLYLTYVISGAAWTAAHVLLLGFGLRIWFSPRADRKAGQS